MLALGFSTSGLIAPVASGFLIDSVGHRLTFALIFVLMTVSVAILFAQRALLPAPHPHTAVVERAMRSTCCAFLPYATC